MKTVRTESPVNVEQLMMRGQVRGARAAVVILALVGATSCTRKPYVTRSELNDSAIGAPARLQFETVRSILEDSKGNYWFGSWKEGVCRFDGKSLTYFTVEDGLSDNQIRSIHEDRNGVVWFEGGVGISGFDGEKIITPTSRNYASKDDWKLGTGDLWFKEDGEVGATELEARPGVYRYDGKTFTYLAYPVRADRARVGAYATTGIAKGKSGRLWFATYTAVFGYSIGEDRAGNIWFGTVEHGAWRYDGKSLKHYTAEDGLTSKDIMGIYTDRHGDLWLAGNGVFKFNGASFDRIH